VPDSATSGAIRTLASREGLFTETAGGVTIAALAQARASGVLSRDEEVVALVTGNGLKTPDAVDDPQAARLFRDGSIDPDARIPANFDAFERWLETRRPERIATTRFVPSSTTKRSSPSIGATTGGFFKLPSAARRAASGPLRCRSTSSCGTSDAVGTICRRGSAASTW